MINGNGAEMISSMDLKQYAIVYVSSFFALLWFILIFYGYKKDVALQNTLLNLFNR